MTGSGMCKINASVHSHVHDTRMSLQDLMNSELGAPPLLMATESSHGFDLIRMGPCDAAFRRAMTTAKPDPIGMGGCDLWPSPSTYFSMSFEWVYMDLCWFIYKLICVYAFLMCLWAWCAKWRLPAALRRRQKKHALAFLEHVPCVLLRFLDLW